MIKKYHIFISSTFDDLKIERQELAKIIIELGHIPITMDNFDFDDKDDRRIIRKGIEESDYFLALAAHKYGAQEGKISIQEADYIHAVKNGVPVIAFIIDEKARWKSSKKEKDPKALRALELFKNKLGSHPRETWTNTADLCRKAQSLLIQEMNLNPQEGWVRSAQAIAPSVVNELSRLSSENEELKNHIRMENGEIITKVKERMKHALKVLAVNRAVLSFYYAQGGNWENARKFQYLRLFKLLVPELSVGKTTADLSRFLGRILNPDLEKTVRKDYPTPSNTIKKIMADFVLLKLVKCSGSGDDEVWEITEYGKEIYSAYRMRQLERAFIKKS
jgi:hypothetical protein